MGRGGGRVVMDGWTAWVVRGVTQPGDSGMQASLSSGWLTSLAVLQQLCIFYGTQQLWLSLQWCQAPLGLGWGKISLERVAVLA